MNNYPEWWCDTITLYNKFIDSDKKIHWYRHIIHDCFYKRTAEKVTIGNTTLATDQSICRIRVDDMFLNKRDWNESSDKENHFTLCSGDIIVAGEIDFEIDEYTKESRSSDLLKTYKDWPGCFVVEYANINVGGGRGNEHYLARGM